MRLTKFAHACVRIEYADHVVVIDPGVFTAAEAVDGATAILLTHEHADHTHAPNLRRSDAPIHTIDAVREQLPGDLRERTALVAPGDRITELGVEVVGEKHAVIYDELPTFANSGYLLTIDGLRIFHPGDALTVPEVPVDVLLLPVSAPWMKVSECIDYARAVGAARNVAIHEAVYSDAGLGIIDGHLGRFLDGDYVRLKAGADL